MLKIKKTPQVETLPKEERKGKKSRQTALKRNLYKWHKIIGLVVVVPVILWTLSGLAHPFMANFMKPEIPRMFIGSPLAGQQPELSLQEVAGQNDIKSLRNFRYMAFNDRLFYQIAHTDNRLRYYDANTGELLPDGDKAYAEYLARYFADDAASPVSVTYVEAFNSEYREINRLLPVYKIAFDRDDVMDVYVETGQSRLAAYNTGSRKFLLGFFHIFHNWAFLNLIVSDSVRLTIMIALLTLIFGSALSGLWVYGLMWNRFKKMRKPQTRKGWLRKYHRQVGLAVSLVTFTFAFSGAFHAFMKYEPDDRLRFVKNSVFELDELTVSTNDLPWEGAGAQNASVISMPQGVFYQLFGKEGQTTYINTKTGETMEDGDFVYARYLANKFRGHKANIDAGVSFSCCLPPDTIPDGTEIARANIADTELITTFAREYGFINKRLPVVKVSYDTPDHLTYYIETKSSCQSVRITDLDRAEGYSFAMLHKYSLMNWAGKGIRDTIMSLAALGVLAVTLLGLFVYLKL